LRHQERFAMKALVEGGEVIEPLRERILGRVTG
jgi:DNA-directed RNA polymerase subunit beta'